MKNNLRKYGCWFSSAVSAWLVCVFLFANRMETPEGLIPFVHALGGLGMGPFLVWIAGTFLLHRIWGIRDRRARRFAFWTGLVFAVLLFTGQQISHWDSLTRPYGTIYSLTLDILCFFGSFCLFFGLLLMLFHALRPLSPRPSPGFDRWMGDNRRSFLLTFGLLMTVYLSCLIFYYPGLYTPDSNFQLAESTGFWNLTNQHSYVHSLIMGLFVRLGRALFGSLAAGAAVFSLVQILLISGLVSFLLRYMARRQILPVFRVLTLLFFGLHPVIAAYSVAIWKDIWFSWSLLFYTLLLTEIAVNPRGFFGDRRNLLLLSAAMLGVLFFKNTGVIVVTGTLPFIFLLSRSNRKKIAAVAAVCLGALILSHGIIMPAFSISGGRAGEPLSVPLQQMARAYVREGDRFTQEQKDTLSEILPLEKLSKLYNPQLSDPVKGSLNDEAYRSAPMRYWKCWAELALQHPRAFTESLLANSYGYWYPEVLYTQIYESSFFTGEIESGQWGYQDPAVYRFQGASPELRHLVVYFFETMRGLPGMMVLFSVALYFWSTLLLALIACFKKKPRLLLPMLPSLMTFLICCMSPVVAECRYAFPALLALPLLTAFTLQDEFSLQSPLLRKKK